jgi:hypothetical protein
MIRSQRSLEIRFRLAKRAGPVAFSEPRRIWECQMPSLTETKTRAFLWLLSNIVFSSLKSKEL